MRRLTALTVVIAALGVSACKPREKIHLEPTKEALAVGSVVHMADTAAEGQLIRGFHQIEQNSWRWTAHQFTVALRPPAGAEQTGARVVAHISFPDVVMQKHSPVTLTAKVGPLAIGSATYATPGEYTFATDLPAVAIGDEPIAIDFYVDKFFPAGTLETRELALIANSVAIERK